MSTRTYATDFKPVVTPQTEQLREDQVLNNQGGFVWAVDGYTQLDRFLILGCEGNTFYAKQEKMVRENAKTIVKLIKQDGYKVVHRLQLISQSGKATKNDAALFVLALCFAEGNLACKQLAEEVLPQVARTGTHLFIFLGYVKHLRGTGPLLRRAIRNWYQNKDVKSLTYQIAKYQQRNGWSHADALRISHPNPLLAPIGNISGKGFNEEGESNDVVRRGALYKYIVGKGSVDEVGSSFLSAVAEIQNSETTRDRVKLITKYNIPRECIPTELLNSPAIWEALLERMLPEALIRNLATMTRVGVLNPLSKWAVEVSKRLTNRELLQQKRIHPIKVLSALLTYAQGHGERSNNTWTPTQQIVDALDKAFYLTFEQVEPTNKRIFLGLDVSSSMTHGTIAGIPGLNPRKACAALALVTAATEPNHVIMGFSDKFIPLNISPRQRLDDVVKYMNSLPFGGTDCSLPMQYALKNKIPVDGFVVFTDAETAHGQQHPSQALVEYRRKMGINAKLVVVGALGNKFTIADPKDVGMLDCVGFSTDTPQIISDFIRG